MSEFERISLSKLLVRDVDMARFFLKYAKNNAKYILKEDEDNELLNEFLVRAEEMEKELNTYFKDLKKELGVNGERIETKRAKKRKKQKKKETKE